MTATTRTFTAFQGNQLFASGTKAKVIIAMQGAPEGVTFLVFDDESGRPVDFDTRPITHVVAEPPSELRGRGRPKLGVVAREITLLPSHWEWLSSQPGGASVALRKLVHEARRTSGDRDRTRAAQEAAYHFMSAMAGNLAGFEEATRALFAYDRRRFCALIAEWPEDVRDHAIKLAFADIKPVEG